MKISLQRSKGCLEVFFIYLIILSSAINVVLHNQALGSEQETKKVEKKYNRLKSEKSLYLLQHAYNPVDWFPWGQEAFDKARKENKLIFLSIGYSTCYWCHVMERQIFENEELAALMNRYFVSIKVDREERPDVDRVYMSALVAMTRSGGWPMTIFLTPDLKPFYGATYIPPDQFRKIIIKIHEIWKTDPEEFRQSSRQLTDLLKRQVLSESGGTTLEKSILTKGYEQLRQAYDEQYAGFGRGPKFPRPATFNFLLRYYYRFGEQEALKMTLATLRKMAEGGVRDHLGGGFHRYSVDGQWRVPHFEKMLYDQAQLASSYLDAYQITHDEFYASIGRDILAYVLREMTDKDGGFYSAQDAESALDPKKLREKEEGAFYVWTKKDIDRAIGKDGAEIFEYAYGVRAGGNALEDPQKVFVKKNILFISHSVDQTAKRFKKPPDEIAKLLAESRVRLFTERQKRPRPNLDDKVLVSWNGLMISALARAYQVLDDPSYLHAAEKSADFTLTKLYDSNAKRLLHRYRAGEARYDANLEDYAFLTMGLLDLYEAAFDTRWLRKAIELTDSQNTLFYDEKNGGFFDTSGKDDTLLFRTKEDHDGAEPAGNSIATLNLLRLSQITNNQQWREMADRTLSLFSGRLGKIPQALPQMLAALDFHLDKPKQIIIACKRQNEDTQRMLREVNRKYLPNRIILLADGGTGQQFLNRYLPFIQSIIMLNGKATAFICENYACKEPTSDLPVMVKQLEGKKEK